MVISHQRARSMLSPRSWRAVQNLYTMTTRCGLFQISKGGDLYYLWRIA